MRIEKSRRGIMSGPAFSASDVGRRRSRKLLAAAAGAVLVIAQQSHAATGADTWAGTTSNLFSNAGNWTTGSINKPPLTGDSLVFNAAGSPGGVSLLDDLMTAATYNIAGITFSSSASGFNYVINPNASATNGFTLTGNITNSSTSLQTINDPMTIATATRTFNLTAGGGDITLGGAVTVTGASGLTTADGGTAGAGTLNIGGAWTSAGTFAINLNNFTTLDITGTGSIISASTLTVNTNGGTLLLQDANAISAAAASVISIRQSANLIASAVNAITGPEAIQWNAGNAGSGFVDLQKAQNFTGIVTVDNNGILRLDDANAVAGSSQVTFAGAGTTLQLRNDAGTTFNSGTGTSNYLQLNSNHTIDVNQFSTGTNQTLALNGLRVGTNNGVFITGGNGYSFSTGQLVLTAAGVGSVFIPVSANMIIPSLASIGATGTNTLTLDGMTSGNQITGVIGVAGDANGNVNNIAITKNDISSWAFTAANTYTGTTNINGGTLDIGGANGSLSASTATAFTGGTFTLDNSAAVNTNRYGDTTTVGLSGGTFSYIGNSGGVSTETIGNTALNFGSNNIAMTAGAGGATSVTSAGITRGTGTTVIFTGAGLGTTAGAANVNNYFITATPTTTAATVGGGTGSGTTTISILPYAMVIDSKNTGLTGGSLATIDPGGNGVRALAASEYATHVSASTSGFDNVLLTSGDTQTTAGQSINALVLGNTGGLAQAGKTLTLGAGTIVALPGNAGISGGTIEGGGVGTGSTGSELIIFDNSSLTISSTIADNTAPSALTLSGSGITTLTGSNTYTGNTSVNNGTLAIGSSSALGTVGNLVLYPSATVIASGGPQTISNPVSINFNSTSATGNNFVFTIGGSNALTLNGAVTNTANANTSLTVNNTALTTLAGGLNLSNNTTARNVTLNGSGNISITGPITGSNTSGSSTIASSLTYAGTGTLTVSGANTYTGATTIGNTALSTNGAAANGAIPATLEGAGTLQAVYGATSSATQNNVLSVGAVNFGGGTLTLTGAANTNNSQSVASVNLGYEQSMLNLNAGSGGQFLLNVTGATPFAKTGGTIDNRSGLLDINLPAGAQTATNGLTTTAALTNTNGILPTLGGGTIGLAINGKDFASSANSGVAGANIVAYTGYSTTNGGSNNLDVSSGTFGLSAAYTLHFGNSTPGAVTVNNSANPLGLAGGVIMVSSAMGANNVAINGGAIQMVSNRGLGIWQMDPLDTLTISSTFVDNGTGGIVVVDGVPGSTVAFSGTNLYSGQTVVSSTTLSVGNNNNLGNPRMGSAIDLDAGARQATGSFALNNGAAGNSDRNIGLSVRGGTIDVTNTNNLTVSGYITGLGGLTKVSSGSGSGVLTLAGKNVYTGPTNINGGQLVLTGTGSLGNTAVTVNAGATLGVTGNTSIGIAGPNAAGSVTLVGGTGLASVGTLNMVDGSVETLNINGAAGSSALTLGSGGNPAALDFDVTNGSTTSDSIALTGNSLLQLNPGGAKINISTIGGFVAGTHTYNLITYGANDVTGTGAFSLGNLNGLIATLNQTSTALQLVVTGLVPPDVYWTGAQNQTWSTISSSHTNWSTSPSGSPDAGVVPTDGTTVHFVAGTGNSVNPNTTTLGADFTITGLDFNAAATSPVTISGTNTLTIKAGGITIDSGSTALDKITATGSAGNAGVQLGAAEIWTNNSNSVFEVDSVIGGTSANALTLSGSGTGGFFLNNANTYIGGTTISAGGIVKLGNAAALSTGAVADNGTLNLNNMTTSTLGALTGSGTITDGATGAATLAVSSGTFSGSIIDGSGTVGLHVAGPGVFAVTGAQTYHGATLIDPGATLQLGDGLTANGTIVNSAVTNNGTLGFGVPSASSVSYTANLGGTGGVSKTGGGSLILGNASTVNSYQGGTTISNGTLSLGNATALGIGMVNVAGGTLDVNGFSPTFAAGLSGSGTIDNVAAGGNVSVTVSTTGSIGFSGSIRNTTGTLKLVKQGSGALTLTGATSSYTGGTDIQQGSIILSGGDQSAQFGAFGSTVTVESGAALQIPNGFSNTTFNYLLVLNGTGIGGAGALEFQGATGRLGFGGSGAGSPPPYSAGAAIQAVNGAAIGSDAAAGTLASPNLVGPISGGSWIKVGGGVLQLEGGNPDIADSYVGSVEVAAGILKGFHAANTNGSITGNLIIDSNATFANGQPEQIANNSTVTVNGTLDINANTSQTTNFTETIGALAGNGTVLVSYGLASGAASQLNFNTLSLNAGNSSNFTGVISDGNGQIGVNLTAANAGVQILSGVNTYTGNTTINSGKLVVNGSLADGTSLVTFNENAVTVGGGTANAASAPTLGGTGTINVPTTVNALGTGTGTAGHIAPGTPGATLGTLTFTRGLNFIAGSNADFSLASSGNSSLTNVASGGLTLPTAAGSLTINLFDDANAGGHGSVTSSGTYELFSFDSLVNSFDPGIFAIGASPFSSASYSFTEVGGNQIDLTITGGVISAPANLTFTGSAANGNWDINNTANFTAGSGAVVYHDGDNVTFNDSNAGQYTIALTAGPGTATNSGSITPGSVTVNTAAPNIYTFGGVGIAGTGTLTKTGTGTLVVNNVNTYSGATNISQGALTIGVAGSISNSAITVGNGTTAGTLNIAANTSATAGILARSVASLSITSTGTVNLANAAASAGPAINTNRTVLATPSLTITTGGTLNLGSNDMIVHSGSAGESVAATITSAVASGRGANGLWTGTGINSSAAAASPHTMALAVVLNDTHQTGTLSGTPLISSTSPFNSGKTTFDNQTVSDGDVLVKYTYYGDALLTGSVNASDYIQIDAGFASGGTLKGWYNGDFNYDGTINGDDYTLIDNAFNTQGSVTFASISAGPTEMIAANTDQIAGPSSSAVPEPTSLSALAIGAAGLLMRRRRRST